MSNIKRHYWDIIEPVSNLAPLDDDDANEALSYYSAISSIVDFINKYSLATVLFDIIDRLNKREIK